MARLGQLGERDERARGVFGRDRLEHPHAQGERRSTEERGNRGRFETRRAVRERLVEQRLGVARRAGAGSRDHGECLGVGFHSFTGTQVGESVDELLGREERELEVLGPRADRRQHLLGVGRREHEHDVRRCLLERLQQCVGGRVGEHVDFVEDVDLPARAGTEPERRALDDVADVVDAAVRRRVELEQIEEPSRGDGDTVLAFTARLAVVAEVQTVQRLGEDPRRRRLPGAARPRQEVGVTDAAVAYGIAHRPRDVLLTDELGKALRPVLAVQGLVRHAATVCAPAGQISRPTRRLRSPRGPC